MKILLSDNKKTRAKWNLAGINSGDNLVAVFFDIKKGKNKCLFLPFLSRKPDSNRRPIHYE